MYRYGVDYYPEHWPEERWPLDAQLMAEAGVNVVRLAEFAWAKMEPSPDHFDFAWLDRALEVLQKRGIQAILGTPTASMPPWVFQMYPDAYKVLRSGMTQTYGNRESHCQTHPGVRQRGCAITRAMAEHYKDHPAVIGWQIDNELGSECYCPICQRSFQAWLQKRYGSLEKVNAAWGTVFWSHTYSEWAQIPVPLETGGVPNPGLALDFRRFSSDVNVDLQQAQINILRSVCPRHFITHNLMGFGFEQLNYFDLARPLDFVAWDNYPRGFWNVKTKVEPAPMALGHATMRGLKNQPFWLMEEQSGAGGWHSMAVTPRPGEMRLWTYQAVAHGADGMVYFRWRTARFGTEQYWHGVLDHHGQPRRRYDEFQQTGLELAKIGEKILRSETRSQVAMVLHYDTRWAFQIQPHHAAFRYAALFNSYYRAFHRRNISVDIVPPDADLSRYRLVVAPAMYVLPADAAENFRKYVENGGTLLVTSRTGVKDESNTAVDLPLPGLLGELCGVEVLEYDLLPEGEAVPLKLDLPGSPEASARLWVDVLLPHGAQTLAAYQSGYYAGQPALTLNACGKGQAVYIGTLGDSDLHDPLVGWLVRQAGISAVLSTPEGVEAVERWKDGQRVLFLLNHSDEEKSVTLDGAYTDLLAENTLRGALKIEPKGVRVLEAG